MDRLYGVKPLLAAMALAAGVLALPAGLMTAGTAPALAERESLIAALAPNLSAASAEAGERGRGTRALDRMVAGLPLIVEDYSTLLSRAQRGLQARVKALGLPETTRLVLRGDREGYFRVEAGGLGSTALEAAINNDFELRNNLLGAEAAAFRERSGAALSRAMRAAAVEPAKAEQHHRWARRIAEQSDDLDFRLNFEAGALSGRFARPDGQEVGILEGIAPLV